MSFTTTSRDLLLIQVSSKSKIINLDTNDINAC